MKEYIPDYSDKAFAIACKIAEQEVWYNPDKYPNPCASEMELTLVYYQELLREFAGPSEI